MKKAGKRIPPHNRGKAGESKQESQRLANLAKGAPYRWKPGQSGNPGGRPKTKVISKACRELLALDVPGDRRGRTYAEKIVAKWAKLALHGSLVAGQMLADRAEGRPRQTIDIGDRPDPLSDLLKAVEKMSEKEGPPEGMEKK